MATFDQVEIIQDNVLKAKTSIFHVQMDTVNSFG